MINPQGTAYPQPIAFHPDSASPQTSWGVHTDFGGMDIRTQIAAMAMQGLLSNSALKDVHIDDISRISVKAATSLLNELNKEG